MRVIISIFMILASLAGSVSCFVGGVHMALKFFPELAPGKWYGLGLIFFAAAFISAVLLRVQEKKPKARWIKSV